ncbi:sulfotransferase 1C4-like [Palaemon carinicauda]|uniref:sulfotransferase 1C4-like n=1 Tax=Palaemon carinicauda TaxID=392227 RepID=UPI0035B5D15B
MKFASGHEGSLLAGAEIEKQRKDFEGYKDLVRLTPGRWLFPSAYTQYADKIYNFEHKSSDVVIMTYPKCGTTWTQEIIWTMRNNPDLNNPKDQIPLMVRAPFIEADMLVSGEQTEEDFAKNPVSQFFLKTCPDKNWRDGVYLQLSETSEEPRTIKTHLPFSLLSPSLLDTCKVVYVARNPKDVIVSYLHHSRIIKMHGYVGTFEDFVQYFVDDDLLYGPYGSHMKEAWERRDHPNLYMMFYEDMKADPYKAFKQLDVFLGTELTETQLQNIVKYTSFGEMKTRGEKQFPGDSSEHFNVDIMKKDGGFFRKGQSGDWKNKFTPESEAKVDEWIRENMTSFGVNFKYSI